MNSVVLESVHKIFRHNSFLFWRKQQAETRAVNGISLTVGAGEVLGLLGPNGSGKSTTLKLISTVLLPDMGRVLVHGHDTRDDGQAVRRMVGLALATERSFFARLTVWENLEFFAALENVPRDEIGERIRRSLERVGLNQSAKKQVMKLSAGMYQRLAIARALIKQPSVLLLDEPTRSLDAASAAELWETIRELSAMRTTILLATHNFEEATAVCDRVGLLCSGELIGQHRVSNAMAEELRELYLDMIDAGTKQAFEWEVPA